MTEGACHDCRLSTDLRCTDCAAPLCDVCGPDCDACRRLRDAEDVLAEAELCVELARERVFELRGCHDTPDCDVRWIESEDRETGYRDSGHYCLTHGVEMGR